MKDAVSKSRTNFRTRIECLGLFFFTMLIVSCGNDDLPSTIDCLLNPIELRVLATEDSNCNLSIGTLEVVVEGDDGPYLYGLNQQKFQKNGLFDELPAGIYNITVESNSGCIDELQVSIKNIDGLDVTSISLKGAGCDSPKGSVTIEVAEGSPPYSFSIDNGEVQTDNYFNLLSVGNHVVTISDTDNCTIIQHVVINSDISFSTEISPIIANNCAISGCHVGTHFLDLRDFETIKENANRIKSQTISGNMPQDGELTQDQIDVIACWVDQGAKFN